MQTILPRLTVSIAASLGRTKIGEGLDGTPLGFCCVTIIWRKNSLIG